MSKITAEDVLRLAKLARLNLTEDEVDKFQDEIQSILTYVEQLQAADTTNLEPTYQVSGLCDVVRPDEVIDYAVEPSVLLHNAPDKSGDYFKVKRMVG